MSAPYALPALCIVLASFVMLMGKEGWGWLLLFAVLTMPMKRA